MSVTCGAGIPALYKLPLLLLLSSSILRALEWGFQLGISQFCTNLGLNCLFVIFIHVVPISCGQDIVYWVCNFGQWAR